MRVNFVKPLCAVLVVSTLLLGHAEALEWQIKNSGYFGCQSRESFDKLFSYLVQNDTEAFKDGLGAGVMLGEAVLVTDTAIFSGMVKVRRKGETQEYWTVSEATAPAEAASGSELQAPSVEIDNEKPWNALLDAASKARASEHHADAEALYKQALTLQERKLGPDHIFVAFSLTSLAEVYEAQNKYSDAVRAYARAAAIRRALPESSWSPHSQPGAQPDQPDLDVILQRLAELYVVRREEQQAESVYKDALVVEEKMWGLDEWFFISAETFDLLGNCYVRQRKYGEAERAFKSGLALWGTQSPLDPDPEHLQLLLDLAALYLVQQKDADAERYCQRSLDILKAGSSPEHYEHRSLQSCKPSDLRAWIRHITEQYGGGRFPVPVSADEKTIRTPGRKRLGGSDRQ